jgi:signal transduction histidine kinase
MRKSAIQLGASFAGWSLLALIAVATKALYYQRAGVPVDVGQELRDTLLDYGIWAALTPAILYLTRRFPYSRATWGRATLVQIALCLGFFLVHEAAAEALHLPSFAKQDSLELRLASSFYNDLWMYGVVVVVATLVVTYQRYRERDVAAARLGQALARAELQALRNQLNPHLLFNALNSVTALMHEDVRAADDMVSDLSHLLRVYLSGDDRQETTVREEVDLVSAYVNIQRRRFADRLTFSLEVEDGLRDALVPSLLLQPIVENAILHGLAPSSRAGRVDVRVSRRDGALVVVVADDGLGMAKGHVEGVGLGNTRARLRQLYGDEQSFAIASQPGAGVTVTITLPLRLAAARGAQRDESADRDRGRRAARPATDRVPARG